MDTVLLKKVAQYTMANLKTPKEIKGYSEEEVRSAVIELENKGVISHSKATKYSPADGNYEIKENSSVKIKSGELINISTVSAYEFEKNYREKLY